MSEPTAKERAQGEAWVLSKTGSTTAECAPAAILGYAQGLAAARQASQPVIKVWVVAGRFPSGGPLGLSLGYDRPHLVAAPSAARARQLYREHMHTDRRSRHLDGPVEVRVEEVPLEKPRVLDADDENMAVEMREAGHG